MLIGPPRDKYPTFESEKPTPVKTGKPQAWYDWFFDCPNWICPKCILTNFGRNKFCADKKCNFPRPAEYKENEWHGSSSV